MKENRRITMTKALLKESLLELLSEKPLNKITIKEICENADINRTTFYTHYADQYALCAEIENDALSKTAEHLEKVNKNKDKFEFMADYLYYIKENGRLLRVLLNSGCDNSFRVRFVELSVNTLAETDYHNDLSDTEKDYMFRYIFFGALSVVEKWLQNDYDLSPMEMSKLIITLMPSITETKRKLQRLK